MTACTTPPSNEVAQTPAVIAKPAVTLPPTSPVTAPPITPSIHAEPPPAPREFRAAWVSTVTNIDWPSRKGLSSEKQKTEIIAILNQAAQLKLNAIILQVRPSADAIYPSDIAPWSEYLSGEQGKAPDPWYDPLQMWVEQAHLRGLELHAWFNPYRVKTFLNKSAANYKRTIKTLPAKVKQYGDSLWLDPADPVAMQQTIAAITDVVHRYDVDGVHLDDYFYPYPSKMPNGREQEFPDDVNWVAYLQKGGKLTRADWRRQNVNQLVKLIYQNVHQEKAWVKFGISPFGIGRPDRLPAGIAGFSQYDKLFADVELWLANGWVDYLAPQLYWQLEPKAQAFRVLQDYWLTQNTQGRYIWPGIYTGRIDNSEKSWSPDEILNQVDATREKANSGHVHFSMVALMQNRKDIRQRLSAEKYSQAALIPAMPWLGKATLTAPTLVLHSGASNTQNNAQKIEIKFDDKQAVRLLAIWKHYGQAWIFSVQAASHPEISLAHDAHYGAVRQVRVSTVDRTGNESPGTTYTIP